MAGQRTEQMALLREGLLVGKNRAEAPWSSTTRPTASQAQLDNP